VVAAGWVANEGLGSLIKRGGTHQTTKKFSFSLYVFTSFLIFSSFSFVPMFLRVNEEKLTRSLHFVLAPLQPFFEASLPAWSLVFFVFLHNFLEFSQI
jgi:hypothetical protein